MSKRLNYQVVEVKVKFPGLSPKKLEEVLAC
jgi:hypothetical protein